MHGKCNWAKLCPMCNTSKGIHIYNIAPRKWPNWPKIEGVKNVAHLLGKNDSITFTVCKSMYSDADISTDLI